MTIYNPDTQKVVPKDAIVLDLDLNAHIGSTALVRDLRSSAFFAIADQIEEQTRPAIEEPTGLGAVVETADGRRYVRGHGGANCWEGPDDFLTWGEFTPVRVLSEGVTS